MADMFDNQMVEQALKNMTPEQLEYYQKIGEQMYNTVDFKENKIIDSEPTDEEMLNYIKHGLDSGLLPKDMEKEELEFISNVYGDKWYEKFGFTVNDIPENTLRINEDTLSINEDTLISNENAVPKKIKRNEKCPCNSGKKFKFCCINKND